MRHLFDQYEQPENRLTHALVMGLSQDNKLLKAFVLYFLGRKIPKRERLVIVEQTVPGKAEPTEEQAEKKGLPDAFIYSEKSGWALIIESKIEAALTIDQLERHLKTARKHNFTNARVLVLATENKLKNIPKKYKAASWPTIYTWLSKHRKKSQWARLITEYIEILEAKMAQKEQLKSGTLTKFSGVPFKNENPYTYIQAKRILELIMDELKKRKGIKNLGVDSNHPGRPAIKSGKDNSVWDFMKLRSSSINDAFTRHPHLTVVINAETVQVLVTMPNRVKNKIRISVFGKDIEPFASLIEKIAKNMKSVTRMEPTAMPYLQVLQRHYKSQSSTPIVDAILRYDIRTVLKKQESKQPKIQPQWIQTTYDVMTHKKSNIQFEFGVIFPYQDSKILSKPKAIDAFEKAFVAIKPFLEMAIK